MTAPSAITSTATAIKTITPQRPVYPIGVPAKFSADGVVQHFPGCTLICHLPVDSPLLPGLQALYVALSSHPILSTRIHLLPPSSWHMTVLDALREKECEPGMWPPGKEKQPLQKMVKELGADLQSLDLASEGLAPPYRVKVRGFDPAVVGIGIEIEGATEQEERRLRRLRDRLADTLGFKSPNHKTYGFHLSMAYLLRHIDGKDREELNKVFAQHLPVVKVEFELGAVEFCTFENMYAFHRLFYLGE
jgi:hypothetical protein